MPLDALAATLARVGATPPETPLGVAVSGGADSMALALAAALTYRGRPGNCHLLHVHHGLRGEEADADARFVQEFGASRGLPVVILPVGGDLHALSAEAGVSLQVAARHERQRLLREEAARRGLRWVLLAHQQDDLAEGVVLALGRGAGLRGLAGMHEVGMGEVGMGVVGPDSSNQPWLRPLLGLPRAALREFLAAHNQTWREDSSNARLDYDRNRVRALVLPAWREALGEHVGESIARTARLLQRDEALLSRLAAQLGEGSLAGRGRFYRGWEVSPLADSDEALTSRVLAAAWAELLGEGHPHRLGSAHLASIEPLFRQATPQPKAVSLPGGVTAERDGQRLWLYRSEPRLPAEAPHGTYRWLRGLGQAAGRELLHPDWQFSLVPTEEHAHQADPWQVWLPEALLERGAALAVGKLPRAEEWTSPDPAGKAHRVADLLAAERVPGFLRPRLPRVLDGEGRVLAVLGLRRRWLTEAPRGAGWLLRADGGEW